MGYKTATDEQFSNDADRSPVETPGLISRRSQQDSWDRNVKPFEDHALTQSGDTNKNGHATAYYVILVAYAAFMYGVSQKALYQLDQKIVPSGDAMTYAVFFFKIIDEARQSVASAITLIVQLNYNWL